LKIYFACTGPNEPVYLPKHDLKTLLLSYHYYKDKRPFIKELVASGVDVFIDSGAFSAQNAGKDIDIHDYIEFIKETEAITYAGLDVIGSAEKTMLNQQVMEQAGLKPIPTFHMGGNVNDLYFLAQNYEYIAIGGMVFSSKIEKWLDAVWKELLNINPKIKCHAFGMTNIKLMAKYPWYSVDSSSFKGGKRFGRLILYNDLTNMFITEDYNKWVLKYAALTLDQQVLLDTAFKYELTDTLSAKGYQKYVDYINNKQQDYKHVTAQQSLFE